jgi:hypothetical protein
MYVDPSSRIAKMAVSDPPKEDILCGYLNASWVVETMDMRL